MIVPMMKLSLLIFYKEYQTFLGELREKGMVHIHENTERTAEDTDLQAKLMLIRRTGEMITHMQSRNDVEQVEKVKVDDEHLLDYLEGLYSRQDQIEQQLVGLEKDHAAYRPWGKFSREMIQKLETAGWEFHFFSVPEQKYQPEWEEMYDAVIISEMMGQKYFVTVTPAGTSVNLEADPYLFPQATAEELAKQITALREESVNIGKELDTVSQDAIERLKKYRLKITEVVDKIKVEDAAQHLIDEKVIALEGWIPVEREAEMRSFLETKEVYFEFTRPTPEDDVPVQLKNNAYSKLFEPVTEMFALPQYRELDLTPFLAPFFMLFFGMCMGDGGYGLIIWLTCFIIGRKASPSVKGYLVLGQYLGIMTVIVGLLTGSFFGIALDSVEWPWLAGVKSLFLTEANYGKYLGGYNPMMIVAVAVGIIQILYGMCLNAARLTKQFGFKYAISTLGWVVAIILLGVLIGLPMLSIVIPEGLKYVLYALLGLAALTIYFYNSPGKGIFSNFGSGLWGTYNMATGLLGDTLSYIRLFAIGLTGSILGGVFNTLAFQLTDGLPVIVKFIAVFLILLIGHSINFGLCMISSFVHPMRLTFVEFYKNAGFEGGGKQYAPFRKKVND